MARVGRLAGAILAETAGRYFLVGDLKEPCDFAREGFEPPGDRDVRVHPYCELTATQPVVVAPPVLIVTLEGDALAQRLAAFLVIKRNGSVSERLWRLITQPERHDAAAEIDAGWLATIPPEVWQIVQESVLRCT
jgi:hypothetical protein